MHQDPSDARHGDYGGGRAAPTGMDHSEGHHSHAPRREGAEICPLISLNMKTGLFRCIKSHEVTSR